MALLPGEIKCFVWWSFLTFENTFPSFEASIFQNRCQSVLTSNGQFNWSHTSQFYHLKWIHESQISCFFIECMTAIVILSQISFHENGKNDICRPQLEKVRRSTTVATIISLCPFKLSQCHHISLQNLKKYPCLILLPM